MADLPKLIKSFCCKALDLLLSEMADLPKLTKSFLLQILLEMPELAKLTKSFLDRGEKVEDNWFWMSETSVANSFIMFKMAG